MERRGLSNGRLLGGRKPFRGVRTLGRHPVGPRVGVNPDATEDPYSDEQVVGLLGSYEVADKLDDLADPRITAFALDSFYGSVGLEHRRDVVDGKHRRLQGDRDGRRGIAEDVFHADDRSGYRPTCDCIRRSGVAGLQAIATDESLGPKRTWTNLPSFGYEFLII